MENLICCCRECNIWKWSEEIGEPSSNLYKTKINEHIYRLKSYLYSERNRQFMGTIDQKTWVLISMYINYITNWLDNDNRETYVNIPLLYWEWSPYWEDYKTVDKEKMKALFRTGWSFCDSVLDIMYDEDKMFHIDCTLQAVFDDTDRLPKNNDNPNKYWLSRWYERKEDQGCLEQGRWWSTLARCTRDVAW